MGTKHTDSHCFSFILSCKIPFMTASLVWQQGLTLSLQLNATSASSYKFNINWPHLVVQGCSKQSDNKLYKSCWRHEQFLFIFVKYCIFMSSSFLSFHFHLVMVNFLEGFMYIYLHRSWKHCWALFQPLMETLVQQGAGGYTRPRPLPRAVFWMVIEESLSLSSQCIFNWAARSHAEQVWMAEGGRWGVLCLTSRLRHAWDTPGTHRGNYQTGVLPDIQSLHPRSNCSLWLLVDLTYHANAQTMDAHAAVHPRPFCTARVKHWRGLA